MSNDEKITRHTLLRQGTDDTVQYLVYHPSEVAEEPSLLVYLYGAGGTIDEYNLKCEPYAPLRQAMRRAGFHILVPDLGPVHFMNARARESLDQLIDHVLAEYGIAADRVSFMGTSMGGGSSLAYTVRRPGRVRSVCAVMPMTDFAKWTEENAHYKEVLAGSYGATVAENRQVYDEASAVHHVGAFESVPVMLIHGDTDPTVPAGHSERLAAKLKERGYPHSLRMVKGVAHVDEIMDGLCDEASAFLIGSHAK